MSQVLSNQRQPTLPALRPRPVKTTTGTAASVAAAALALAACGSGIGTHNDLQMMEHEGAKLSSHVSGPLLISAPTDGQTGSPGALVAGVVAVAATEAGQCVTVGGVPVFWPHGSTWDATTQAVTVPHGKGTGDDVVVRIGQHVEGAGAYRHLPEANTADHSQDAHALARSCVGPDGQVASFTPSTVLDVAPAPPVQPAEPPEPAQSAQSAQSAPPGADASSAPAEQAAGAAGAAGAPQAVFSAGPILVRSQPSDSREQMGLGGTVSLLQAGGRACLSLQGMPIVFEHGATWDEASATARTVEGVTLSPGQHVEGGGSTLAWSGADRSRFTGEAAELIDACVGESGQVAFFHPQAPPS